MKIIATHLVVLQVFRTNSYSKIYKVVETDKGKFYRESWNKGSLIFEEVSAEDFYEENAKENLVVTH
jgi:hypothetical protein